MFQKKKFKKLILKCKNLFDLGKKLCFFSSKFLIHSSTNRFLNMHFRIALVQIHGAYLYLSPSKNKLFLKLHSVHVCYDKHFFMLLGAVGTSVCQICSGIHYGQLDALEYQLYRTRLLLNDKLSG